MTSDATRPAVSRRRFLGYVGIIAGATIMPAFRAQAMTPIKIGYTAGPEFGAAYIAKEKGFFAKHGLDVSLQTIALTSNVPATLVSESLQIGGTTPPVFLTAVENGLDLVGIAATAGHRGADESIGVVVGAKSGINDAKGLAGKKFAVPGLTGALHIMVVAWLDAHGVDASSVDFVEVPFPQLPAVLAKGDVDAIVTIRAFVKSMVADGTGIAISGFAESFPDGIAADVYACNRSWADANPDAINSFRAALADAVAFAKSNQAAARDAIGVYFKAPKEILDSMPFPDLQSTLTPAQLKFWADALVRQGYLKNTPDLGRLIA
ncbi:ABC transporter substrate-binding protein [Rhizobium sp. NPDC090279]|uniref:ABC transporter substrate-binding protein n=1 Tax=Rhizobium sp. NPDC090279 TaxID=3364499 RepID=UPI00383AF388